MSRSLQLRFSGFVVDRPTTMNARLKTNGVYFRNGVACIRYQAITLGDFE